MRTKVCEIGTGKGMPKTLQFALVGQGLVAQVIQWWGQYIYSYTPTNARHVSAQ